MITMRESWSIARARDFLSAQGWFAEQPSWFRDEVFARSVIKVAGAGTIIGDASGYADGAYAVLEGQVDYILELPGGGEGFCCTILPRGWFGYGASLDSQTWSMRRVAARPTVALYLPKSEFDALNTERPESYRFWAILMDRFAWRMVTYLIDTHNLPAKARVAAAIVHLSEDAALAGDGNRIQASLTKADLASQLGITRQYVSRFSSELTREGLIEWNRQEIVIKNLPALRRIAETRGGPPR